MSSPDALLIGSVIEALTFAGIAVFAMSGALRAAENQRDFVTFVFFAVVTAVGGGTIRDLLIGAPIFWMKENTSLTICFVAALIWWFLPSRRQPVRWLLWFDAAGLSLFAATGAVKAMQYGISVFPAIAMGISTACIGGFMRDILAHQPSILLRSELYVTAAALSAAVAVLLISFGYDPGLSAASASLVGFLLRAGALHWGWKLKTYQR